MITIRALLWGNCADQIKAPASFAPGVPSLPGWIARPRPASRSLNGQANWGGSYAALMADADMRVEAEQNWRYNLSLIPADYTGAFFDDWEAEWPADNSVTELEAAKAWNDRLAAVRHELRPNIMPWGRDTWLGTNVALCLYPTQRTPALTAQDLSNRRRVAGGHQIIPVVSGWMNGNPGGTRADDQTFAVMMALAIDLCLRYRTNEIWVWGQADSPLAAQLSSDDCARVGAWMEGRTGLSRLP